MKSKKSRIAKTTILLLWGLVFFIYALDTSNKDEMCTNQCRPDAPDPNFDISDAQKAADLSNLSEQFPYCTFTYDHIETVYFNMGQQECTSGVGGYYRVDDSNCDPETRPTGDGWWCGAVFSCKAEFHSLGFWYPYYNGQDTTELDCNTCEFDGPTQYGEGTEENDPGYYGFYLQPATAGADTGGHVWACDQFL